MIVSPVHNEEELLPLFLRTTEDIAPRIEEKWRTSLTLCFVDDGSRDQSPRILEEYQPLGFDMEVVRLSRNFGKEAAISAGIEHAGRVDAVIIMDSDLQHPPELLDRFLHHWQTDGYEMVFAYKEARHREGLVKTALSNLFYRVLNQGNRFVVTRDAGDFRLVSAPVIAALAQLQESERFMKGLYAWVGFRQLGIPFTPPPRPGGDGTRFSPARLMLLAIDGITSFTVAPLRLMSLLGILIAGMSFIYGAIIVIEKLLLDIPVPGLASTLAMISLFGGLQLLCVGLIGEYVGKTLMEAKRRPPYLVASRRVHRRPDTRAVALVR